MQMAKGFWERVLGRVVTLLTSGISKENFVLQSVGEQEVKPSACWRPSASSVCGGLSVAYQTELLAE